MNFHYGDDPKNIYRKSVFIEYSQDKEPKYLRYDYAQCQFNNRDDENLKNFLHHQVIHYYKDTKQDKSKHHDEIVQNLFNFIRNDNEHSIIFDSCLHQ